MRLHLRDATCRHERGSFGGLARPARVCSCFGDGADAARRGALEHGLPISLVAEHRADGTADVFWRNNPNWFSATPLGRLCAASWPRVLDAAGSDRCGAEAPTRLPAASYLYPRPSPVLPVGRRVVEAVRLLDADLDAAVERVTEERIGWRVRVWVRHQAGGRGGITIRCGYGEAWIEHATVPPRIVRVAQRALKAQQNDS